MTRSLHGAQALGVDFPRWLSFELLELSRRKGEHPVAELLGGIALVRLLSALR